MTAYAWKESSRLHLDAQACGQELERLQRENNGITAPVVVEAAKDETSPLHPGFEWDDSIAAYEYRLTQARLILRCIVMTHPSNDERQTRAFVVVRETQERGDVYLDSVTVFSDSELRAQALSRAMGELQAFRRKYADLQELADVLSAIDKLAEQKAA